MVDGVVAPTGEELKIVSQHQISLSIQANVLQHDQTHLRWSRVHTVALRICSLAHTICMIIGSEGRLSLIQLLHRMQQADVHRPHFKDPATP